MNTIIKTPSKELSDEAKAWISEGAPPESHETPCVACKAVTATIAGHCEDCHEELGGEG